MQGKPAAYVCRNFACSMPVTEPFDLAASLDKEVVKSDKGGHHFACGSKGHGSKSRDSSPDNPKTKKESRKEKK